MLPEIAPAATSPRAARPTRSAKPKASAKARSAMPARTPMLPSERDLIVGWLEQRCREIQQRVAESHGRFKAVARCELATARAILRDIECGDHVTHCGSPDLAHRKP